VRIAHFSLWTTQAPGGRDAMSLSIGDGHGRAGLGEAAPLPGFSRDDVGACASALRAAIHGLPEIAEVEPPLDAVARALAAVEPALAAAPTGRFALETALLDLLARRRGEPLRRILGGPRPYDRVPVNGLVLAGASPDELVARASALRARGIGAIKVKLRARDAQGFARELDGLARLRAAQPELELRLDVNGAWSIDDARVRLEALRPLAPRFVEQPVARGDLALLGPCAVPWAADESLVDAAQSEALLDGGACSVLVLKPALLGLARALSLATRAQARGVDVVVTHAFDGPVGFAAACELALGLPRAPLACGLDPEGVLGPAERRRLPQLAVDGVVVGAAAPGLGVEVPA
jgi:o-succinylbenzoate synthase